MLITATLMLLLACDGGTTTGDSGPSATDDTGTPGTTAAVDLDQDGADATVDCDDDDPSVFPGADEVCDERDQDCDDAVDEGFDKTWWPDADGDGYGDQNEDPLTACEAPGDHWVHNDRDCQDGDALAFPGAEDICDGADNNCNETIDEDADFLAWWPDLDGDGTGDSDSDSVTACGLDATHALNDLDCDDTDAGTPRFANPSGAHGASGEHGDPSPNVQSLLDQHTSCIVLDPGRYVEQLIIKDSVTITGTGAPGDTVLDAGGSGTVLYVGVNDAELALSALTVTGGLGQEYSSFSNDVYHHYSLGGGLYMYSGRLALDHVVFEGNHGVPYDYSTNPDGTYNYDYSYGGALYLYKVDVVMTDVDLLENSGAYGSALYVYGGIFEASRVRILGNESDLGNMFTSTSSFVGRNLLIAQNRGSSRAWYATDESLDLAYTTIADNEGGEQLAFYGGGLGLEGVICSGGDGYGIGDWVLGGTYSYSLFDNLYGDYGPDSRGGIGLLWEDPQFADVSDDGDWTNDDYALSAGSPAVDSGPPIQLDPDGTPADMGYWGGPEAP